MGLDFSRSSYVDFVALLKLGMLFRLFGESKRNKDRNDFCFLIQSDVLPKILGQTKSKSPRKSLEKPRTPKGSELPLNGGFRKSI
jgi:hypothetical protein